LPENFSFLLIVLVFSRENRSIGNIRQLHESYTNLSLTIQQFPKHRNYIAGKFIQIVDSDMRNAPIMK